MIILAQSDDQSVIETVPQPNPPGLLPPVQHVQWKITAGQVVKMCWQVAELDLADPDVLEEQLTGVDLAYFQEVIDELRRAGQTRIDGIYLFELIDKIF